METYQVIVGYSDIKAELKEKCAIFKPLSEIRLWFTFEHEMLCVHDYDDHDKYFIVALYDSGQASWKILLRVGTYGDRLVLKRINSAAVAKLAEELNREYSLMGYGDF